jgi:hypothetical protein
VSDLARAVPYLQSAIDRSYPSGILTIRDVLDKVAAGQAQLWPGRNSAAVTNPEKAFNLWLAGGDMRELLQMLEAAEAQAKAQGFDCVTVSEARPGWDRVLAKLGYVPHRSLVKVL